MLFDVGRLLHEEFLPVYRAAADTDGWEDMAVSVAHRAGSRLASAKISIAHMVMALRSTDRLLTEAMLDDGGDARALAAAGTALAAELMSAFCAGDDGLADAVLAGSAPDGAAAFYTVVSVRGALPIRVVSAFRDRGPVLLATSGHLLLPAAEAAALSLCLDVQKEFGGEVWFSVAERPVARMALARREADEIDALVASLGRPPGVYRIDDVLLESAVMETPEARDELGKVLAPLLANPVLVETVLALLEADGNRAVAAKKLFIHRSTIDYRSWQIEQLTGLSPVNPRDLAVLGTAIGMGGER
ncbi:PucR-like helix-turn-helix protein [Lentzea atacamensis]|uniref:PucR-like helix-turn-helix protein n=1 Tax=Lentzea atacamensis TaxID=531938 RepID=A0ABX9E9J0_9PSEU|nr:helix-turn-helix domain-containing protein [Lentzea atacamensis]RAS66117.1 PucR-like helix-turn-helix protein [Lentzea atacamensis]